MAGSIHSPIPPTRSSASADFVGAAQRHVLAGNLLPGAGAEDSFNDLAFALPGGAKESYFEMKRPLIAERLAGLAPLWELE